MAARAAAAPPAAPAAADGDDFNDGFDVTAPPVLHGVPFAGRARFSVLSHLRAAHSSGGGLFGFMTMAESNKVRVQCREARAEVAAFEWADSAWERPEEDFDASFVLDCAVWRSAFPAARAINVSGRKDLCDADFVHIRGGPGVRLHTVRMFGCRGVTDAAFAYLRGVYALDMSECRQDTITDAAFAHLRASTRSTRLLRTCAASTHSTWSAATSRRSRTRRLRTCAAFTRSTCAAATSE
jgi:hypothetical protein